MRQKYVQPFTFVSLFRRLTRSFVGKITGWSVHSNANQIWLSLMLVTCSHHQIGLNNLKGTANLKVFSPNLFGLLKRLSIKSLAPVKIQPWKITQQLGIIPLARLPTVSGRGDYSEPQSNPFLATYIIQLFNMITLSPDIPALWGGGGMGRFIFELVDEPMKPYHQDLSLQWVPPRRSSGNMNLLTNSNSLHGRNIIGTTPAAVQPQNRNKN